MLSFQAPRSPQDLMIIQQILLLSLKRYIGLICPCFTPKCVASSNLGACWQSGVRVSA